MKKITVILFLYSISYLNGQEGDNSPSFLFEKIKADGETEPVRSSGDAADDVAIWVNPNNHDQTIVIGTDKKWGLITYNLKGEILSEVQEGRINNVDVLPLIKTENKTSFPIICSSNRSDNSVIFHRLYPTGRLQSIDKFKFFPNLKEVYGICFYEDNDRIFLFVSDKKGTIEQWDMGSKNFFTKAKLIRTIKVRSTVEGMVGDPFYKKLYFAEEKKGLWQINVYPDKDLDKKLILKTDKKILKADWEGLALWEKQNGYGFILISIQGSNKFCFVSRKTKQIVKTFEIKSTPQIDGVEDTDGLALKVFKSDLFPEGILVVQDGKNGVENQNFKYISLSKLNE
ncbi:MAG: phytase [Flavobacteriaceae bacterium]